MAQAVSCSSDSAPSPGTSICRRCSRKKKKRKKKIQARPLFLAFTSGSYLVLSLCWPAHIFAQRHFLSRCCKVSVYVYFQQTECQLWAGQYAMPPASASPSHLQTRHLLIKHQLSTYYPQRNIKALGSKKKKKKRQPMPPRNTQCNWSCRLQIPFTLSFRQMAPPGVVQRRGPKYPGGNPYVNQQDTWNLAKEMIKR